jgi:hypothetical protein
MKRTKIAAAGLTSLIGLATLWAPAAHAAPNGPDELAPGSSVHVSIGNAQVTEGDVGFKWMQFPVTLSQPADENVAVDVKTIVNQLVTAEPTDYGALATTLHFLPGTTNKTLYISVKADTIDESTEVFAVQITSTDAKVMDGYAIGAIIDNDAPPTVSVSDLSKLEGTGGPSSFSFTVSLSAVSEKQVKVDVAAESGSATSPADFQAAPSTLIFIPGQKTKLYGVSVVGDGDYENNENFGVKLSTPINVTLADATGLGTVVNDDAEPEDEDTNEDGDEGNGGGGGGQSSGTTVDQQDPAPAEGEQALSTDEALEAAIDRRAEGVSVTTWLLVIASGLTMLGVVILVTARRRRRI